MGQIARLVAPVFHSIGFVGLTIKRFAREAKSPSNYKATCVYSG